jgi:hypothetical protein
MLIPEKLTVLNAHPLRLTRSRRGGDIASAQYKLERLLARHPKGIFIKTYERREIAPDLIYCGPPPDGS